MLEFIKFWIYAYVSYLIASLIIAGVAIIGIAAIYSVIFLIFGLKG